MLKPKVIMNNLQYFESKGTLWNLKHLLVEICPQKTTVYLPFYPDFQVVFIFNWTRMFSKCFHRKT